jgi:hypothetical protein
VNRSLRILETDQRRPVAMATTRVANTLFWWGLIAVLLQFILPYVVLAAMGLPPDKVKLHPSTVMVIICATYALLQGGTPVRDQMRKAPGLLLFLFVIPGLALYSTYFTGFSGSAVYVESYWAAGLLAFILEPADPKLKRLLARILIGICVLNVFVGLYESFTFNNWFPLVIDPDMPVSETNVDFRANAFYNHPLTASLITSMAIFLLYAMRPGFLIAAPTFCILLVGLLAFGGRTALGVTLIMSVLTAFYVLLSGIVRRNLKLDFVIALVAAAITIPILSAIIVTQTSIAERIMDTLYYDDSAAVRATQWEIFRYLSLKNWLFGISHDDLNLLKYQIGLGGKETDIENFWFLMLLNLGLIGFTVFLAAFGGFLYHLGRYTRNMNGWLLLISALIIDSGSNSLGVKTCDLFIETAFLMAISGYADVNRAPRIARKILPTRVTTIARLHGALAYGPNNATPRGLRTLTQRII